tara:strand:- start:551 stop:961 length:411 start_codon:yes stop_codon:yes gene_type:complete
MFLVGVLFNPMNILAYRLSDIYLSLTLIYGGLLMASNMIWSHQIVHYLSMGHFNLKIFVIGILLSLFCVFLLRSQLFVDDQNWLRRMIGHHSTALTTTNQLLKNKRHLENDKIYRLAKDIIYTQENEILTMKNFLS